jgi:hypothetical protein
MNHPLITMPADDIAAVITFVLIAIVLAAVLAVLDWYERRKPKSRRW